MDSSKAENQTRYFVFGSAIFEVVVPVFRGRLENYYRGLGCTDFQAFLNHQPITHIMFHLRFKDKHCCFDRANCFNQPFPPLINQQWNQLYTNGTSPKCNRSCHCKYTANPAELHDLDLTLVALILLEVCNLPKTDVDNIKNLRKFKNLYLSHNKEGCISKDDFDTLWGDLTTYILQLDPSKQDDLVRIQNRPLDVRLYSKYHIDLIDIHNQLQEIERKLDHRNAQMNRNITDIKEMITEGFSTIKDRVTERPQIAAYKLGQDIFCPEYKEIDLETVPGFQYRGLFIDGLMTDDGTIVLCDNYNKSLLICNSDGSSVHTIPLENYPWSVTAVNDSTVAVTFLCIKTVEVYDINRRTKLRSIKVHVTGVCTCSGITTLNNMLAVGGKEEIWMIDYHTGQVINTIKTNHRNSRLHTSGERLFSYECYLLGSRTTIITCYNQSGEILFTTTPLPSVIRGVTTLQDGSLYVACKDGKVYHLSSDGQNYQSVQMEVKLCTVYKLYLFDELVLPYGSFMYNQRQQKLITGNFSSMKIYHTC